MALTIAIVGRPNVGKSTLFNRLVGRRLALVDDTPGVTRDRRVHAARLMDLRFDVVDTAGLEEAGAETLEGRMRRQTERAIAEADLILFVVDAKSGITPADRSFAQALRRAGAPLVLVANKAEARGAESGLAEAWELGLGEPVALSAEHGQGMEELRDAIVAALGGKVPAAGDEKAAAGELQGDEIEDPDSEDIPAYDRTRPLAIAVAGRPNAGKSTLVNRLIGDERMLTGPEAGITRDSISVDWAWRGRPIRLFDTAGLRRKSRIEAKLERLSVADTLRAVRFAEVVIVVIDATAPFEKQDLQIADLVIREGRAPVIAFNKWDLIDDRQGVLADLRERTARLLPQIKGLQAVPVSAETGHGLDRLMEAVARTHEIWNRRIPTGPLNRWLAEAIDRHPPPAVSGRRLKIKYLTQVRTRPPGFIAACTRPEAVPAAYERYLVNGLREAFDMPGVPIRLIFRAGDNPFAGRARRS
jgi:GTP-binding protein